MKQILIAVSFVLAMVTGCGGDDGDAVVADTTSSAGDSGSVDQGEDGATEDGGAADGASGSVVDPAPPGQATASIDGQEFVFAEALASGCSISGESITYGFAAADGVTTLAAGLNQQDDEWLGSIRLEVPDPDGEGIVGYSPKPAEGATLEAGSVVVDGSSMSYSGPILKQPPNDGSNPPPIDIGTGTISASC